MKGPVLGPILCKLLIWGKQLSNFANDTKLLKFVKNKNN